MAGFRRTRRRSPQRAPTGTVSAGRELGVRNVLEGSVRKAGNRVRITGQLIDAFAGTHLWADRFDGSLEDVLELQEKVAVGVAGVTEPALGNSTSNPSPVVLRVRPRCSAILGRSVCQYPP
jgi:TolB-like protein